MNSELEKAKNELEDAINNSSDIEKIFKISSKIDKEIEKLYKDKLNKEEIEKMLDAEQSREVIVNIKSDLLNRYYNISPIELDILSRNIYDYCCLMANDVPEQEIVSYITKKNSKYYDQLSEKARNSMTVEFNVKYFKHLILKYTKILKE